MSEKNEGAILDSEQIKRIIPHRYPFLLVDKIVEIGDDRIVGVKNVTVNEPFFAGHFPDFPVMPGVLIVEALAQTGAVLLLRRPEFSGKIALFAGIENFKFRRQVVPGDALKLEVNMLAMKRNFGKAAAEATVSGALAASGIISFAVVDKYSKNV
jgi:3-hydroxyacyl-[acyl-carrier-protein] dehydratase